MSWISLNMRTCLGSEEEYHQPHCATDVLPRSRTLAFVKTSPFRLADQTLVTLKSLNDRNQLNASQELERLPMLTREAVLSSFLFRGLCSKFDTHNLLELETMYFLSVGLSKILKECIATRLKDDSRVTESIVHTIRKPIPFNTMKRSY